MLTSGVPSINKLILLPGLATPAIRPDPSGSTRTISKVGDNFLGSTNSNSGSDLSSDLGSDLSSDLGSDLGSDLSSDLVIFSSDLSLISS